MNPIHLVTGAPAAFAKQFNKLIATSDVGLSVVSLTFSGENIVAVAQETGGSKQTRGALLEVRAITSKHASAIAALAAENPCWSIASAFDFPAPAAKQKIKSDPKDAKDEESQDPTDEESQDEPKLGVLVIAVLCQP